MINGNDFRQDVLFGRGYAIQTHPGNQHFRSVVEGRKAKFKAAPVRRQKKMVAAEVMEDIAGLDPPGKFLMEDTSLTDGEAFGETDGDQEEKNSAVHPSILSKRWVVVDHERAVAKVMHRLRDAAASPAEAKVALAASALAAAGSGEEGGLNVKKEGKQLPTSVGPGKYYGHLSAVSDRCDRESSPAHVFNSIVKNMTGVDGGQMQRANDYNNTLDDDDSVGHSEGSLEGEDDAMVDMAVGYKEAGHINAHALSQDGGVSDVDELRLVRPMNEASDNNEDDEWDSFMQNLQRLGSDTDDLNYNKGPCSMRGQRMTTLDVMVKQHEATQSPSISPSIIMQALPPSTVEELIQSGRLSDSVILLKDDDEDTKNLAAPIAGKQHDGDVDTSTWTNDEEDNIQHLVMENAARVALCLARSFDNICCRSDDRHNLSTMQLNDFFINLNPDDDRPNQVGGNGEVQQHLQELQPGFSQFDGMSNDYHNYFQAMQKASTNGEVSIASSRDAPDENADSKNPPRIHRYKTYPRWVLLGIDNLTPDSIGDSTRHREEAALSPIQILGRLLYSVFAIGKHPPPSYLFERTHQQTPTSFTSRDGGGDDCNILSFQRLRMTERSVFTRLIEENNFPTSVCLLLSDMIDVDPQCSAAVMPITSFGDVIQDLEQMVSRPQTYLHNDTCPPAFGQKYYGREEEVATLRKVARQMMESRSERDVKTFRSGLEAVFVSGVAG